MLKALLTGFTVLTLGCASVYVPVTDNANDWYRPIDAEYNEIWNAVVEIAGKKGWRLDVVDRDSGILTTAILYNEFPFDWIDCGEKGGPMWLIRTVQYQLSILVREGHVGIKVRAAAMWHDNFVDMSILRACTSLNGIETWFWTTVEQRLNG